MWYLRIFIDGWCGQVRTRSIEEGLGRLKSENPDKLVGDLAHQPATRTIYHNGVAVGCYYWD